MTRPQLFIWYEKTIAREYSEQAQEEYNKWQRASSILAAIYSTAMGAKKQYKAKEFMPDIETDLFKSLEDDDLTQEDYLKSAEKAGIKPPKNL